MQRLAGRPERRSLKSSSEHLGVLSGIGNEVTVERENGGGDLESVRRAEGVN